MAKRARRPELTWSRGPGCTPETHARISAAEMQDAADRMEAAVAKFSRLLKTHGVVLTDAGHQPPKPPGGKQPKPRPCPGGDDTHPHNFRAAEGGHCAVCGHGHK